MNTISALPSNGIQRKKLLRLVEALVLAIGVLLVLLAALHQPAVAGIDQGVGYVDGAQGQDVPSCGNAPGMLACKTIQYAIDEPNRYDVISVTGGIYAGSLRIERDLTLQGGWNAGFTVRDPLSYETIVFGESGTGVHAVTVATATTVFLDSLTVFRGDDGVHLLVGAEARLTNLRVHGMDDEGIESNGTLLIVSNTEVFDTGDNGILVDAGSAEIYSSTVHHAGQVPSKRSKRGIYLRGTGPDVISDTVVYDTADDGIRIRDAGSGSLINNRVYSSTADGIQVDNVAVVLVSGNRVYDVANQGLQLQLRSGNVMTAEANVVYRTGSDGILAEPDDQYGRGTALIQGNTVYSTTGLAEDGIHVNPGITAVVKSNTVYSMTGDAIDFKGLSGVIEDNRLYAVGDAGVQVSVTSSISVIRNEISDTVRGIYVGPGVAATIDDNTVHSVVTDGINFQGTAGWIRYNTVHHVGDQGINVNADDTTVLGNEVYDTQGEGLRVRSGSQVLIRDNVIYNVLGAVKDGIRIEPNVTAVIVANTIYNATDDGITFNGSVGTIGENVIRDNGASGIDVDADAVTISANRVFSNGVAGIELERAGQFTVSNNLVGENVDSGVLVIGTLPSAGWLVNNTLVGHSSSPLGVGVNVLSNTVTLTSANNIIVSHTVGISVAAGAWVTTTYDDLWHNGASYGISHGAGSIHQDPLLVDAASRDYHLLLGSPCIDKGWESLAQEFPFDFEGHPRADRIEIGADEVGMWAVKEAPAVASPGAPITYTITISNYHNVTLTQVVITDAVPTGAHLIGKYNEHGAVIFDNGIVWWTVDSISPTSGTVQVGFVVTATETITNDRYRVVTSTQGVSSGLGPEVVTVVGGGIYLPLVVKNHGG